MRCRRVPWRVYERWLPLIVYEQQPSVSVYARKSINCVVCLAAICRTTQRPPLPLATSAGARSTQVDY